MTLILFQLGKRGIIAFSILFFTLIGRGISFPGMPTGGAARNSSMMWGEVGVCWEMPA